MNEQIYHRKESDSQTAEVARRQIESQEIWGGPCRNFMYSDIPKVKAYPNRLPIKKDLVTQERGIEFKTKAEPDRGLPRGIILWSSNREGVISDILHTSSEYAMMWASCSPIKGIQDFLRGTVIHSSDYR
jgi:hypothetical protein